MKILEEIVSDSYEPGATLLIAIRYFEEEGERRQATAMQILQPGLGITDQIARRTERELQKLTSKS